MDFAFSAQHEPVRDAPVDVIGKGTCEIQRNIIARSLA